MLLGHTTICHTPLPRQNCVQVLHRGAGLSATRGAITLPLMPAGRSTVKPRAVSRDVVGGQPTHYQAAAVPQLPTPASHSYASVLADPNTAATPPGERQHIHTAFGAFYAYLGLMTAAATSPDWNLDFLTFGGLWGLLWAACAK
jgi:hypothetical protein